MQSCYHDLSKRLKTKIQTLAPGFQDHDQDPDAGSQDQDLHT